MTNRFNRRPCSGTIEVTRTSARVQGWRVTIPGMPAAGPPTIAMFAQQQHPLMKKRLRRCNLDNYSDGLWFMVGVDNVVSTTKPPFMWILF